MAGRSLSFGLPHARPTGVHHACGELDEINNMTFTRYCNSTAFFHKVQVQPPELHALACQRGRTVLQTWRSMQRHLLPRTRAACPVWHPARAGKAAESGPPSPAPIVRLVGRLVHWLNTGEMWTLAELYLASTKTPFQKEANGGQVS